jgi:hypothetical protein
VQNVAAQARIPIAIGMRQRGQAGTSLQWHNNVNEQVLNNYFTNYLALNNFVDDIDFETHQYTPSVKSKTELVDKGGTIFEGDNMKLEIFVMANDNSGIGEKSDRGFGWVHHREANWQSETMGMPYNTCLGPSTSGAFDVDEIDDDSYNYKLSGFKPGDYFIEVYNTKTGALILSSSNNNDLIHGSVNNILRLGLPHKDLYKNNETDKLIDYAFKFWHVSVNGNDLRSTSNIDSTAILPEIQAFRNDDELKEFFIVNYFPNPSSEHIQVSSSGEPINSLIITDLAGNVLLIESELNKFNFELSITSLAQGVYLINIKSTKGFIKIFKLIKL